MSELMNAVDTDSLAAEYVLGTLDSDERAQAVALLTDEAFAAKVRIWERRLGELHLMVEPVEPDARLWERIKGKMPEVPATPEHTHSAAMAEVAADQATLAILPAETPPPSAPTTARAGSDAASDSSPEAKPAPAADVRPVASTSAATAAAAAAAPGLTRPLPAPTRETSVGLGRKLRRWRAVAILLTLLIAAIVALLALWRFVPERLPLALQPRELIPAMGGQSPKSNPPPRRTAPPQFEE
jgi:hypothetical protein